MIHSHIARDELAILWTSILIFFAFLPICLYGRILLHPFYKAFVGVGFGDGRFFVLRELGEWGDEIVGRVIWRLCIRAF